MMDSQLAGKWLIRSHTDSNMLFDTFIEVIISELSKYYRCIVRK